MVKRVSALSQVLKETQAGKAPSPEPEPQNDNTVLPQNNITLKPQNDNTVLPQQTTNAPAPEPEPQNNNAVLSQNSIMLTPQYNDTAKPQRSRKTDERDKVTYYLDPGQIDKLEELRITYRKATGKRLNEQDFMRLIVSKIDLHILL